MALVGRLKQRIVLMAPMPGRALYTSHPPAWPRAKQVVAIALKALHRRKKPVVVTGLKNKLLINLKTRLMPTRSRINIMGERGRKEVGTAGRGV